MIDAADSVILIVDHLMGAMGAAEQEVGGLTAAEAREALLLMVATQVKAFDLNTPDEIDVWCAAAGRRIAEQMNALLAMDSTQGGMQ